MGALRIGSCIALDHDRRFLLFQTQADALLFLFNATPLMMKWGFLPCGLSLAFWFAGVNICLSTFFQALGLENIPFIIPVPTICFYRTLSGHFSVYQYSAHLAFLSDC